MTPFLVFALLLIISPRVDSDGSANGGNNNYNPSSSPQQSDTVPEHIRRYWGGRELLPVGTSSSKRSLSKSKGAGDNSVDGAEDGWEKDLSYGSRSGKEPINQYLQNMNGVEYTLVQQMRYYINSNLQPQQAQLLRQLQQQREYFESYPSAMAMNAGLAALDAQIKSNSWLLNNATDADLLRFLRARNSDMTSAWQMLQEHATWRVGPTGPDSFTDYDDYIFSTCSLNKELYWAKIRTYVPPPPPPSYAGFPPPTGFNQYPLPPRGPEQPQQQQQQYYPPPPPPPPHSQQNPQYGGASLGYRGGSVTTDENPTHTGIHPTSSPTPKSPCAVDSAYSRSPSFAPTPRGSPESYGESGVNYGPPFPPPPPPPGYQQSGSYPPRSPLPSASSAQSSSSSQQLQLQQQQQQQQQQPPPGYPIYPPGYPQTSALDSSGTISSIISGSGSSKSVFGVGSSGFPSAQAYPEHSQQQSNREAQQQVQQGRYPVGGPEQSARAWGQEMGRGEEGKGEIERVEEEVGRAHDGLPVLIFRPGFHESGKYDDAFYIRYLVWLLERGRRLYQVGTHQQMYVLVDRCTPKYDSYGHEIYAGNKPSAAQQVSIMSKIALLRLTTSTLQSNYPEVLHKAFIVPVNAVFSTVYSTLSYLADEHSRAKVNLIRPQQQQQQQQLQQQVYGQTPPQPAKWWESVFPASVLTREIVEEAYK